MWHDSFTGGECLLHVSDTSHTSALPVPTNGQCVCDMTRLHVRHDSFTWATWFIYMSDMTHLRMRHDSFTCATWLIYMCHMAYTSSLHLPPNRLQVCPWHTCHMPHTHTSALLSPPHKGRDSFTCAPRLIYMCLINLRLVTTLASQTTACACHSYVCHDAFVCMGQSRCRTHISLGHDSFVCATWLIYLCDMTRSCVRHDSFTCAIWRIHLCDPTHPPWQP